MCVENFNLQDINPVMKHLSNDVIINLLMEGRQVIIPMTPLHRVGPISYRKLLDPEDLVRCHVDYDADKLSDNYKVTFLPTCIQDQKKYGSQRFYISDFCTNYRAKNSRFSIID